ncbi:cobalamin biosynthesis protein, partial [Halorubrum amylolyticum]|uniref:cobalamin biosynthesis protein n=1 Tax=Halorubrum amylolyticum TaxID=2508724 RepID=UPI0013E8D086
MATALLASSGGGSLFLARALAPLAALAIAVALDLALAEPPARTHPVALFGSVAARFDRSWSRPRLVGVAVAAGLPLAAAAVAGGVVAVAALGGPLLPVLVAGALLFSTVSLRMLLATAAEVVALTETDPDAARESIRALAGRDATDLSPADLRSAAVESAAENLADGFVAPLGGFALGAAGGLAVGPTVGAALGAAGGAGPTA